MKKIIIAALLFPIILFAQEKIASFQGTNGTISAAVNWQIADKYNNSVVMTGVLKNISKNPVKLNNGDRFFLTFSSHEFSGKIKYRLSTLKKDEGSEFKIEFSDFQTGDDLDAFVNRAEMIRAFLLNQTNETLKSDQIKNVIKCRIWMYYDSERHNEIVLYPENV